MHCLANCHDARQDGMPDRVPRRSHAVPHPRRLSLAACVCVSSGCDDGLLWRGARGNVHTVLRFWRVLSYGFHMLIIHCSLARRFRPPVQNMHGQRRIGGRLASSVAEAARSRLTTRRVAAPRRLPVCPCEHATGAQWDGVLDWRAADRRPMRWLRHGGGVMHRPLVQHEEGAGRCTCAWRLIQMDLFHPVFVS